MEMMTKNELIEKIYATNGKEWQSVNEVYKYDDGEYCLLVVNTQNRWRIAISDNKTHSFITDVLYKIYKHKK